MTIFMRVAGLAGLLLVHPGHATPTPPEWAHSATGALAVLARVQPDPDPAALDRAVAEAILRVGDPGARVLSEAERLHFEEERDGRDFVVGVRLTMSNGWPAVLGVASNSPAARAGLQPGDLITAVNGQDLANVGISRAAMLLRGHAAARLQIEYQRAGRGSNEVAATLEMGPVPAVETAERLGGDLAYLRLNGIFPGTAAEVAAYLTNWQTGGRFGVVLDLRGADGRADDEALALAARFEQAGRTLCTWKDVQGRELTTHRVRDGEPFEMPLLALVDAETTGAAELLAAVLAGGVRGALVVGSSTSGDPLVRELVSLGADQTALVATRRLVTADGRIYDGRSGLVPDVKVEPVRRTEAEYEPSTLLDRRLTVDEELEDRALRSRLQGDLALRRAVDVLLGLKALNIRAFRASAADRD